MITFTDLKTGKRMVEDPKTGEEWTVEDWNAKEAAAMVYRKRQVGK